MTKAEALRTLVATLDGEGLTAEQIAAATGITVARVDRILDDQDPQHDNWERAPAIEPLTREPKASKGEGTQLRVRSSKERGEKPRRKPTPKTTPQSRKVIECGTVAGFYRHKRLKEPKCQPCKDAYIEYDRVKRPRVGGNLKDIQCGTVAGRGRHKRMHEPICEPCRLAYNEWQRSRYAVNGSRSANPIKPIEHGTAAGNRAHLRRGETPCDPCREAFNEARWKPINHGTHGGYMAHRRRGEEPCDPCRAGHSETNQRHKKKTS